MTEAKKETGLLLQISRDGKSIRVIHPLIEKKKATAEIERMAQDGIEAKYFPEKTVGEFREAIQRLNKDLKSARQPTVKILHKAV